MSEFNDSVINNSRDIMLELLYEANLDDGEIIVIGCSTSEVMGEKIGSSSSWEIAESIYEGIISAINSYLTDYQKQLFLAFQCCEHLNRALLIEEKCLQQYNFEQVTVVPSPKAGGSLPSVAYTRFDSPVMIERITAHAGLDIGDTFIGMHLKPVAVPVRPSIQNIGSAHVTMAKTRPRLIGGNRAIYK
ncbi:TIGR01440 family protein [Natranaerobius thermophilus JW/NM-WN-LF]|uniref:UPF0340 protein Nther_0593 n=2 Tax=Natranaerobius TaxID=375928 RepID=B2A6Q5_NATTJ|nr:TIGR01440 family protein [Natranaerobius thermophilus]ACB84188.1 conserved hypothetical protein [Natranaerobius thermophilus JW/NM-WN-LF]